MTKMNELELQRLLFKESNILDNADTYNMPYEKAVKIHKLQNEMYHKWLLLKGIREARKRISDREGKNGKSKRLH
jgi:hypothetical protein